MAIEALSNIVRGGVGAFTPGGGGVTVRAVDVLFAGQASFNATMVEVSLAGVTPTSVVTATLAPSADWDADDLEGFSIVVSRVGTDIVDLTINAPGPIGGVFRVVFTWSNA
jgi:hypothetical protein